MAISFDHKSIGSVIGTGTYKFQHFGSEDEYDYGDGSLNKVLCGYESRILVNGHKPWIKTNVPGGTLNTNCRIWSSWESHAGGTEPALNSYETTPAGAFIIASNQGDIDMGNRPWQPPSYQHTTWPYQESSSNNHAVNVLSGTNEYSLTSAIPGGQTVHLEIGAGGYTTNVQIGALQFRCNDTLMSLKEMVDAKLIKPLVLISSHGWSTDYVFSNLLNLYDNSSNTNTTHYPGSDFIFMTNEGCSITAVKFYANRAFNTTYDGMRIGYCSTELIRYHLSK